MQIALTAAATLLALVSAGCGSSDDALPAASPAATSPAPGPTSASAAEADPAMVLSAPDRGSSCFDRRVPDLGLFEAQWKATQDLDSVRFRLSGAQGVSLVGAPVSVPPRNFGGRVDYSGSIVWGDFKPLATSKDVNWPLRSSDASMSATADQSGLLLLHLRFDPKVLSGRGAAKLGDLVATYKTSDGTKGKTMVPYRERFTFKGASCR